VARTRLESLAQVDSQLVELFGCGRLGHGCVERAEELGAPVVQLGGLDAEVADACAALVFGQRAGFEGE
jgi:hypothetical protein